jgi:hypothetical protein
MRRSPGVWIGWHRNIEIRLNRDPPGPQGRYCEQIREAGEAIGKLSEMTRRLELRFPATDPLVATFTLIRDELLNGLCELPEADQRPPDDEPRPESEAMDRARDGFDAFCAASRSRLGMTEEQRT